MTHTPDRLPHAEGIVDPPDGADDAAGLLREFLADRDVPCPRCC